MESFRPYNETAKDRENQTLVVLAYCDNMAKRNPGQTFLACQLSPMLYAVDYAIFTKDAEVPGAPMTVTSMYGNGGAELFRWMEVKARKVAYDSLMLSVAKYQRLRKQAVDTGVPSIVALCRPDGLFIHEVDTMARYPIYLGGNARGQPGDLEPVTYIPQYHFHRLCDSPIKEW